MIDSVACVGVAEDEDVGRTAFVCQVRVRKRRGKWKIMHIHEWSEGKCLMDGSSNAVMLDAVAPGQAQIKVIGGLERDRTIEEGAYLFLLTLRNHIDLFVKAFPDVDISVIPSSTQVYSTISFCFPRICARLVDPLKGH